MCGGAGHVCVCVCEYVCLRGAADFLPWLFFHSDLNLHIKEVIKDHPSYTFILQDQFPGGKNLRIAYKNLTRSYGLLTCRLEVCLKVITVLASSINGNLCIMSKLL